MAAVTTTYSSTSDSSPITITMPGASSTHLAGQQSTIISNVTDKFLDVRVFGQMQMPASGAQAGQILIYAFAPTKFASSSFNYPFATSTEMAETDAARTFVAEQRNMLKLAVAIATVATNDQKYSFSFNIAPLFDGAVPVKWGLWLTHSAHASSALSSSSWIHYTGIKADVT